MAEEMTSRKGGEGLSWQRPHAGRGECHKANAKVTSDLIWDSSRIHSLSTG